MRFSLSYPSYKNRKPKYTQETESNKTYKKKKKTYSMQVETEYKSKESTYFTGK